MFTSFNMLVSYAKVHLVCATCFAVFFGIILYYLVSLFDFDEYYGDNVKKEIVRNKL